MGKKLNPMQPFAISGICLLPNVPCSTDGPKREKCYDPNLHYSTILFLGFVFCNDANEIKN